VRQRKKNITLLKNAKDEVKKKKKGREIIVVKFVSIFSQIPAKARKKFLYSLRKDLIEAKNV
jgi:hypothetical protein